LSLFFYPERPSRATLILAIHHHQLLRGITGAAGDINPVAVNLPSTVGNPSLRFSEKLISGAT
jgi:hypothetical protein